jgi:hypothetical protein
MRIGADAPHLSCLSPMSRVISRPSCSLPSTKQLQGLKMLHELLLLLLK